MSRASRLSERSSRVGAGRIAEALGTALLNLASRLLLYAERQYGEQISSPLPPEELPSQVEALLEELARDEAGN